MGKEGFAEWQLVCFVDLWNYTVGGNSSFLEKGHTLISPQMRNWLTGDQHKFCTLPCTVCDDQLWIGVILYIQKYLTIQVLGSHIVDLSSCSVHMHLHGSWTWIIQLWVKTLSGTFLMKPKTNVTLWFMLWTKDTRACSLPHQQVAQQSFCTWHAPLPQPPPNKIVWAA